MSDTGWIGNVIAASRPQAIAALLRNFRALDAAAWLIMVARNAGIDTVRRRSRLLPLPPEEAISDLVDVESAEAKRLDAANTPAEAAHIRGQIEQLTANAAAASRS